MSIETEIEIGDKVRLTLNPSEGYSSMYPKPVVGIVKYMRLGVEENGEIEAWVMIVFTEDAGEKAPNIDIFPMKRIDKIEVLEKAPESLIKIIKSPDVSDDDDLFEQALLLLRFFPY